MSDEVIKILDNLADRIGIAIDWSSKNIVPYLKDLLDRYVDYEIQTSCAWIIIFTIFTIACVICMCATSSYANKQIAEDSRSGWGDVKICVNTICAIIIVICIIGIICQVFDIIECRTIPEKTIYEYIQNKSSQY